MNFGWLFERLLRLGSQYQIPPECMRLHLLLQRIKGCIQYVLNVVTHSCQVHESGLVISERIKCGVKYRLKIPQIHDKSVPSIHFSQCLPPPLTQISPYQEELSLIKATPH
jgi:hypothetical protein